MTSKTEGAVGEYVTAIIGGWVADFPRLGRIHAGTADAGALSPSGIAGVLNLRSRIVTMVDLRARLGLPKKDDGKPPMALGVDLHGESYGLLIDQIGEVLRFPVIPSHPR